ncbi:hypothetical protein MMC15_003956 [Xylographa vitiligo]|nr:hypothetical protein [Xylographa vitiligo]
MGTGTLFPISGLRVQAPCRPEDSGHAAAFFSFLRTFDQYIRVAISGVAFQNQLRKTLLTTPAFSSLADEYSKDATALVNTIKGTQDGLQKTDPIQAYSDGIRVIWLLITVISTAALASSCFTKASTLVQEHNTKRGFSSGRIGDAKTRGKS